MRSGSSTAGLHGKRISEECLPHTIFFHLQAESSNLAHTALCAISAWLALHVVSRAIMSNYNVLRQIDKVSTVNSSAAAGMTGVAPTTVEVEVCKPVVTNATEVTAMTTEGTVAVRVMLLLRRRRVCRWYKLLLLLR